MKYKYSESHYIGGKKRRKMIFFVALSSISIVFLTIFQILFSIFSISTHYIQTTTFYYLCIQPITDNKQIQNLISRGAGGVQIGNEIALALYTTINQAESVQNNLAESTLVKSFSTPKLSLDNLTPSEQELAKNMYENFVDTLSLLCLSTIEFDSNTITEHEFRIKINNKLINLENLYATIYTQSSHNLSPFLALIIRSISELNYLISTTTYTDNLTPFISTIRAVTLNLLFASNTENSKK